MIEAMKTLSAKIDQLEADNERLRNELRLANVSAEVAKDSACKHIVENEKLSFRNELLESAMLGIIAEAKELQAKLDKGRPPVSPPSPALTGSNRPLCPMCLGTGTTGDNGPGWRNNDEVRTCDCQEIRHKP